MRPEQQPKFSKSPSGNLETNTSSGKENLSTEQRNAIKFAAVTGKLIQDTYPGIAMDFINGSSLNELMRKYTIQERFGVTNAETARAAVRFALLGYSEKFSPSYSGLITDPEIFRAAAKKHQKDTGERVGKIARDTGTGLFGLTEEEKKEVAKRGGAGAVRTKTGIHSPSSMANRSIEGKKSALVRGFTVLLPEVETFIRSLDLTDPKYITRKNKINIKLITEEVNSRFYPGDSKTNKKTLYSFMKKMRKRNASDNKN